MGDSCPLSMSPTRKILGNGVMGGQMSPKQGGYGGQMSPTRKILGKGS